MSDQGDGVSGWKRNTWPAHESCARFWDNWAATLYWLRFAQHTKELDVRRAGALLSELSQLSEVERWDERS